MKNFRNKKMTRINILKDNMFYVIRKGKCKNHLNLQQPKIFFADINSIKESMYDYQDCLNLLLDDKIARRWFIKNTKNIKLGNALVKDFITSKGLVNFEKAENYDNTKK